MKSIRLLPVVIFAAAALLVFKGFGLVTNGGYVLVGTSTVAAAGSSGEPAIEAEDNLTEEQMASMIEPTMQDTDPTAADTAPTLPLGEDAAAGHGPVAAEHAAQAEAAAPAAESEIAAQAPAAEAQVAGTLPEVTCPPFDPAAEAEAAASAEGDGHAAAPASGEQVVAPVAPAGPDPCVNAQGDAVPVVRDADGNLVPFSTAASGSEGALMERLGDRRTELDSREQELEMRMALVEAAEKRINERTAVLQQLEARINALVDQNKDAEEAQFKAIISMYETMKPKEAALIFDELDLNTLLRVARAMNPRKMAPIMAKMEPTKAKDLTAAMAIAPTEPTVAVTAEDLAALPQIVGQ